MHTPTPAGPADPAGPRRKARPGRNTGGSGDVFSADAEVSAATDLWLRDHAGAAKKAGEAATQHATAGETEHAAFWRYVEAHAHFDRGRPHDLAAARKALEDATANGPRTTWFRRLARTVADLEGYEQTADDTDRFFLAWDERRREAGARLDRVLSTGRALLTGSHDEQCEGLKMLARLPSGEPDNAGSGPILVVPPAGFEPALPPPEGGALSPELRGPCDGTTLAHARIYSGRGCPPRSASSWRR
jgi:hypothetical protein